MVFLKRKISVVLSVIMIIACIIPSFSFAADDKGFSDAVKAIKQKIDIPDDYKEIDSYKVTYDGIDKWMISWNKDKTYTEGISVCIDSTGRILSYSKYNYNKDYSIGIPNISKQEAKKAAEEFINKMDPDYMSNIRAYENINYYGSMEYTISYYRVVNGLPFYNDGITVDVDYSTGEVTGFNCTWTTDLEFPSKDDIITQEEAQENFEEKLGMRLVYKSYVDYLSRNDRQIKVFLAYEPVYGSYYCIDAKTGEVINDTYYGIYSRDELMLDKTAVGFTAEQGNGIVLTPEELAESDKYKNLLSKEEAEKKARDIAVLGIDSGYELVYSNLTELWYQEGQYQWYMEFGKNDKENKTYSSVTVQMDAVTGELESFYSFSSDSVNADAEPKYDKDAAKAEAEKFFKQIVPEKFSQTVYDNAAERYSNSDENAKNYSFYYLRKANDILFPNNYLNVSFDAVTGKITSFTSNWYKMEISAPDKEVIELEKVYEKLYNDVGLQLQYKVFYKPQEATSDLIYPSDNNKNKEVKIVYAFDASKSMLVDAYTGDLIDYDGSLYVEDEPITYDDIAGCEGEKEILALADIDIGFTGGKFKPHENIIQKDFMYLIAAAKGYNLSLTNDDIDNIYEYLKSLGIIKEDEIDQDALITREEAAKFIIRALGLEKAAQIKGIYNVNFADADSINEDLIGYVVLAEGLQFISRTDGKILPKNNITREEAALIIYNYLKQ